MGLMIFEDFIKMIFALFNNLNGNKGETKYEIFLSMVVYFS
jgi:hypothetical protein